MSKTTLNDFAVVDLRSLLRARNLKSYGPKSEMLARLQTAVPDWENKMEMFEKEVCSQQLDILTESEKTVQDQEDLARNSTSGNTIITAKEFELLRRENELLERELELMRREK